MRFEVLVEVSLRPGISDPQGATVERALPALGYDGVDDVRIGKAIHLSVEAPDQATAAARVGQMAERLLANPVIEQFDVRVLGPAAAAGSGSNGRAEAGR